MPNLVYIFGNLIVSWQTFYFVSWTKIGKVVVVLQTNKKLHFLVWENLGQVDLEYRFLTLIQVAISLLKVQTKVIQRGSPSLTIPKIQRNLQKCRKTKGFVLANNAWEVSDSF